MSDLAIRPLTIYKQPGNSSVLTDRASVPANNAVTVLHTLTDDGAGGFINSMGAVNYAGQNVSLRVLPPVRTIDAYQADFENASAFDASMAGAASASGNARGGSYATSSWSAALLPGSSLLVTYQTAAVAPETSSTSLTPDAITIDLAPYTTQRIVPGSVRFRWMGELYDDVEGVIYRGRTASDPGTASGRIDYATGLARMTDWVPGGTGPSDFQLLSLWTQNIGWSAASVFFMTSASPIQPSQVTITCLDLGGNQITVSADLYGNLTGTHAVGKIDYQNGLVELQFGDYVLDSGLTATQKAEWWYNPADVGAVQAGKIWRPWPIDPTTLRYNAVSNFYLPVDPDILGLDPVRLPQDGRVPIYRKGRIVVVGHNEQLAAATYSNGDAIDCGRTRLSHVWLIDANGELITDGYTATEAELDAGVIHVTNVAGWAQPVIVEHRIQDMALCTDVQIDGTLGLNIPLSHNYPAGSVVSSALLFGTTYARVANLFDQQAWDGVTWADSVQGNTATATYNDTAYPVLLTNSGALPDRYALRLKSSGTQFDFISEHMGTLGLGDLASNFTPANPVSSSRPLLTLAAAGWGGGWVAGNTLFLKAAAAMQSMAVVRTVQPGTPTGLDYSFDLLTGGDIDRPPSAP